MLHFQCKNTLFSSTKLLSAVRKQIQNVDTICVNITYENLCSCIRRYCIVMIFTPYMLVLLQWQLPVLSGGQHVSAAAAGRRTHGVPEPGPVLRFDTVESRVQIVPTSAQRQSAGEWTDAVTWAWWAMHHGKLWAAAGQYCTGEGGEIVHREEA